MLRWLLQTSIVFTLEKGPGVLFKALSVFALRDINLTKVWEESLLLLGHGEEVSSTQLATWGTRKSDGQTMLSRVCSPASGRWPCLLLSLLLWSLFGEVLLRWALCR